MFSNENMDTELFIKLAKEVHGEFYDYSKSVYIEGETKILIICPRHEEFRQNINSHLSGHHCFKCGTEQRTKAQSKSIEKFIHQANDFHKNKYDYSKVEYVNSFTKIEIICEPHGSFFQTPHDHLKKQGCPTCGKISRIEKRRNHNFVKQAQELHPEYIYDNVKYVNNKTKVEIICPPHGPFDQIPNAHLKGQGCPECWYEKFLTINPMYDHESVNKIIEAWENKTEDELNEINEKRISTFKEKYGISNPSLNKEVIAKIHESKKKNGSYGKSKIEIKFGLFLEKFGTVELQKFINGWAIDYYLKNIYIQLDGVYYHGLDRSLDEIGKFRTETDKNIYTTYLRDRKQDQWFKDNNLSLYRVTDLEASSYLDEDIMSNNLIQIFERLK